MKTNKQLVRSAVTVVTTGLTLLTASLTEAHGPGGSGMSFGGMRGGGTMNKNAAVHQNMMMNRGFATGLGQNRNIPAHNVMRSMAGRDDRGGRGGERQRGDDRGRGNAATTVNRGEREPGDDHGRHREPRDDRGGHPGPPLGKSLAISVSTRAGSNCLGSAIYRRNPVGGKGCHSGPRRIQLHEFPRDNGGCGRIAGI